MPTPCQKCFTLPVADATQGPGECINFHTSGFGWAPFQVDPGASFTANEAFFNLTADNTSVGGNVICYIYHALPAVDFPMGGSYTPSPSVDCIVRFTLSKTGTSVSGGFIKVYRQSQFPTTLGEVSLVGLSAGNHSLLFTWPAVTAWEYLYVYVDCRVTGGSGAVSLNGELDTVNHNCYKNVQVSRNEGCAPGCDGPGYNAVTAPNRFIALSQATADSKAVADAIALSQLTGASDRHYCCCSPHSFAGLWTGENNQIISGSPVGTVIAAVDSGNATFSADVQFGYMGATHYRTWCEQLLLFGAAEGGGGPSQYLYTVNVTIEYDYEFIPNVPDVAFLQVRVTRDGHPRDNPDGQVTTSHASADPDGHHSSVHQLTISRGVNTMLVGVYVSCGSARCIISNGVITIAPI